MIEAKVIADSMSVTRKRLVTFQCTYPRFIHAEVMTHRDLSRNANSSRALGIQGQIDRVATNPALPIEYSKNRAGMVAGEPLSPTDAEKCRQIILDLADDAIIAVSKLKNLGLHKQWATRYLEPWEHITTIISATQWNNFFSLRCADDVMPDMAELAYRMRDAMRASHVTVLRPGEWHLPFLEPGEAEAITAEGFDPRFISAARSARVSYDSQDRIRPFAEDMALFERLHTSRHFSPEEHVATPYWNPFKRCGNFVGFKQLRHSGVKL